MRAFIIPLVLAAGGCTLAFSRYSVSSADAARKDISLAYGYIDMADAPSPFQLFKVRRVLPRSDDPFVFFATGDNLFYHEALTPGSYQFASFEGISGLAHLGAVTLLPGGHFVYGMPAQGGGFRVTESGLQFLGAYKYKNAGSFFVKKFDIQASKSPSEREVLEKLLPRVSGTRWEKRVAKRIKELAAK
jgi:hypothetical protein